MQATKIAVIGGGSGISVVLRGLKQFCNHISAIVTVADDGGSSGVLREDLGMLPPGDIRNCIVALSNTESVMAELMQHRFKTGQFADHSLGNIIIAGLVEMTGSFEAAMAHIHDIFAVTGRVLPASLDDIVLLAKLTDGTIVRGESNIPSTVQQSAAAIAEVFIEPAAATAYPASVQAILDADIVLIGPGSYYTSIMPILLLPQINEALRQTKAKIVLTMNLMTQPGETTGMSICDHLRLIRRQIGETTIDHLLVNSKSISAAAERKYAAKGAQFLRLSETEKTAILESGINLVAADFLEECVGYVRHDAIKLSQKLLDLVDVIRYVKQS